MWAACGALQTFQTHSTRDRVHTSHSDLAITSPENV
jgi:hypothetical protein